MVFYILRRNGNVGDNLKWHWSVAMCPRGVLEIVTIWNWLNDQGDFRLEKGNFLVRSMWYVLLTYSELSDGHDEVV